MPEQDFELDQHNLAELWRTVQVAKAKAKSWTTIADAALDDIKNAMGEAAQATIAGKPVLRHTTRDVTRLDQKKLRADLPTEVLAPYLKTTTEHRYETVEVEA